MSLIPLNKRCVDAGSDLATEEESKEEEEMSLSYLSPLLLLYLIHCPKPIVASNVFRLKRKKGSTHLRKKGPSCDAMLTVLIRKKAGTVEVATLHADISPIQSKPWLIFNSKSIVHMDTK